MSSILGFCQGEANHWYFGFGGGLEFANGNPLPLFNGQLSTIEGCSTISNESGNLLLYTNGQTVWNKNHQVMENGTQLFGDLSSSQAAVITKKPGSASIFYIFTTNPFPANGGFRYSEVDLAANGGLGEVTVKNELLYESTCEKLSIVKHANGEDFWAVTHVFGSDEVRSFKITGDGIDMNYVSSFSGSVVAADTDFANAIGYMKISPDGKKLVACHSFLSRAELFDFDPATGIVSNPIVISNEGLHVYGAEFSTSSDVLYISAVDEKKLFQYDLKSSDIPASKILLAQLDALAGALQLAPNGKIYMAMGETNELSVINNADLVGLACDFEVNDVSISATCMIGLPSFSASLFDLTIKAQNICAGKPTNFTVDAGLPIQSVFWNFGDGNTSADLNPVHIYPTSGNYTVTATIIHGDSSVIKSEIITILPQPVANNIATENICASSAIVYQLAGKNAEILNGQLESEFAINYFASMEDAQNNINNLPNEVTLVAGNNLFFASVTNMQTGCNVFTSFTITLSQQPMALSPSDYIICEASPYDGTEIFDLAAKNTEILGGQDAAMFNVSYFETLADAESNTSALPFQYSNISDIQTVYVRVSNLENTCYAVSQFNLVVSSQPKSEPLSDYVLCDDTIFDGTASFDLSTRNHEALGALPADQFLVSYFTSLSDAENLVSPISNVYTNTQSPQTIFVRVENELGCMAIRTLRLEVKDCRPVFVPFSFPKFFTPNGDGRNDNWQIISSEAADFTITIFDKTGKLIRVMPGSHEGWDGTLNGEKLAPTDYWFIAADKTREYKGHFSLLR